MKKAAIIVYAAIVAFFPLAAQNGGFVTYALLPSSAALYNEANEIVCTLPATYYTVLCGEESGGKYPVSYLDLSGYVRAADITVVDYEPVTKFASLTAKPNNDGMAVNLRDKPHPQNGKVLCSVPPDAALTLYGSREGGELFAGAGNVWQYVRYNQPDGGTFYGYVDSAQLVCDEVVPNSGEKVPRPSPSASKETSPSLSLSRNGAIALAVTLCVPAGMIMLVLFYRPDSKRTPRHSK